jgi:DNA mismatch repair protein MutL
MVVIDQHALTSEYSTSNFAKSPRRTDGNPAAARPRARYAAAGRCRRGLESRDLRALGIEIEPFGGDTLLMSSYLAMLANLSPAEMLRQVVELLVSSPRRPSGATSWMSCCT